MAQLALTDLVAQFVDARRAHFGGGFCDFLSEAEMSINLDENQELEVRRTPTLGNCAAL